MQKKKSWHKVFHSNFLSKNNKLCTIALGKRRGTMRWVKEEIQSTQHQTWESHFCSALSLQIFLKKESYTSCLNLYNCSPNIVSVLEMALGPWLICLWGPDYLVTVFKWQVLCQFRFQGSLSSAHSLLECLDYCHQSIVKLINFFCSLV